MSPFAVLSMAVAGNMIILLASPPTPVGVYALQATPTRLINMPRSCNFKLHSTQSSALLMHPPSLSTSNLFGVQQPQQRCRNNQLYSTSNGVSGNNAMDAEITDSSSTKNDETSSSSSSFLGAVDNLGMNLKPWALKAYERSGKYTSDNTNGEASTEGNNKVIANRAKSILCKLQANALWMLYIIYRGYRGFFVILPGVFREVHRQLKESDLVVDPYGDDNEVSANADGEEPMKLRTRITISALSVVLTASYVVTGMLRVLGKFIKTFTSTTSVESSLEAAADEVVSNEDKLRNKMK